MNPPQEVLTLLALTGAATSTQLGERIGLVAKALHGVLGKLEAGRLIAPVARVRLAISGRPQTVWSLLPLGARRAGLYFTQGLGREALVKGLLKTHFVLANPEGYYPLFFADQVAFFEERGEKWPWQGKEGPVRVSAQIRIVEDPPEEKGRVHVGLAVATLREARPLLEPQRMVWAKRPGYRLTLLATEEQLAGIRAIFNPLTDWHDPYLQQQKTYREWRAILRGLAPEEERYRHHIERVLKWVEMDGTQESAERHDLVMRAFPEPSQQPEMLTLFLGPIQLLQGLGASNKPL